MRIDWRACGLQAALLCLIFTTAHAASPVFGDGLKSVSPLAWGVVFMLSTMSGLVSLLNRVMKELGRVGEIRWPKIFTAAHMTGSWLAGLVMFLVGQSGGASEWVIDLGVILASFGGAVFIEKAADRYLSKQLGYDVTAPTALGQPEERQFADTMPAYPPRAARSVPPPAPVARRPAPVPPMQPPLGSDFAPLDDG